MQPRAAIPPALMDHLRYPEDLFKVQRYQFARYHVTDAERLLPGQQPLGGARRTRTSTGHLQPPYRLFVDQPADTGAERSTFSLTSVFTPYKQEQPGRVRLGRLRRDLQDLRADAGAAAARPADARARA